MRMKFTSPRTTVLNQTLQSSPIVTSPTMVALGAMNTLLPNWGYLSSTGSITGMRHEHFGFKELSYRQNPSAAIIVGSVVMQIRETLRLDVSLRPLPEIKT